VSSYCCELAAGSFTALVGPFGGGKSTVAKLIARFWDVNSGEIRIGNNPKASDEEVLRQPVWIRRMNI